MNKNLLSTKDAYKAPVCDLIDIAIEKGMCSADTPGSDYNDNNDLGGI